MHGNAVVVGKTYQRIGIIEGVGILTGVQITHLHDIARRKLAEMRKGNGLLLGTGSAVDNAVVLIARIYRNTNGETGQGFKAGYIHGGATAAGGNTADL